MASLSSLAQAPMVVPSEMEFAGVKLKITNSAKKEIEETLDLLTRSQYHFQLLVDRSNLYMGMVEEVLKREGIPDDFKYLAIQEGQFISDAVSTSNAVGFWQFKKASAQELGLRVDGLVDERKHIIASTIGATKYFKRSNFVFDNWLWSMQSYLQGLGGTQRSIPEKDYGVKRVEINAKTHWYLKKYIAHKLAFQDYVGRGKKNPELQLATYEGRGKTLREVSREVNVDTEELKNLNKWLVGSRIPDEKSYKVIYPVKSAGQPIAQNTDTPRKEETKSSNNTKSGVIKQPEKSSNNRGNYTGVRPVEGNIGVFPRVTGNIGNAYEPDQVEMNGIDAIRARSNDNVKTLASRAGKSESKIRKYNDLGENSNVRSGAYYYVKSKKNRGKVHYHIVQPGETLWSISQDYGIKFKKLLQKNRMRESQQLKVGRVLWLRFIRPSNVPVEYTDVILPKDNPTPEDKLIKEVSPPEQPIQKQTQIIPEKKVSLDEDPIEEIELGTTKKALIATASDTIITHIVQPKESFFAISQKYGIELDDIIDWNGLNVMDGLQINQELRLVVPKAYFSKQPDITNTSSKREVYHEVQKGETLWGISRKYNVTIEDILKWNNKTDNNLDLGERLKILQDN